MTSTTHGPADAKATPPGAADANPAPPGPADAKTAPPGEETAPPGEQPALSGPGERSAAKATTTAPALRRRLRTAAWLLPLAAVTVLVTAQALSAYVPPDLHTSRIPPRSELHFALLVTHLFTAALAVLTGIAQCWPWLRRRHRAAHRWTGRAYFFAGVFPSALVGIPVVCLTPLGLSNQLSLGVLDTLWLLTGIAGYRAAVQRRYADHRVWMVRSYALTLVAITSRLLQPLVEHLVAAQLADPVSYAGNPLAAAHDIASTSSWSALVLNLLAAEYLLRRPAGTAARRRVKSGPTRTAPGRPGLSPSHTPPA